MPGAPVISVCHGGGPLPLLNHPGHAQITHSLQNRVPAILHLKDEQRPKAILLVTAHWEEPETTISNGVKHDMMYDYSGFPRESYSIKHNAPGDPAVAELVAKKLAAAGLKSSMDDERGWDHGVFVPMKLINPAADIPIVQMSVLSSQSPEELFKVGQALSSLREENVAIIGSGSASFHNIPLIFSGVIFTDGFQQLQAKYAQAMEDALATQDPAERLKKIKSWRQWPGASEMHPPRAAEHLSPQIVCAGAAGDRPVKSWTDEMMGSTMKSYYWD